MDIKITPSILEGTIDAIPSKSDAHRCLICAALADRPTTLHMSSLSQDIEATISCLTALGAKIETDNGNAYTVSPIRAQSVPKSVSLDCRESGSTLRFLLPLATYLTSEAEFFGNGRLPQRPIAPLIRALSCHGCFFSGETLPFTVIGHLNAGTFDVPGNISSQFLSGLLFALPLLDGQSEICMTTAVESSDYVEMTLSSLRRFGVTVDRTRNGFAVPGNQQYKSPDTVKIDGDWSNAAFFLTAGALGKTITYQGLDTHSIQGDRRILSLLEKVGAQIETTDDCISVSPGRLMSSLIDISQIPDLLPILAVTAALSSGITLFVHAGRLRLKESDRLQSTCLMLRALGAEVRELSDSLEIIGKEELRGGEVDSFKDHRIAMAAAIASIRCRNPVIIRNAQAVGKSYPGFFNDFNKLGGKADVIELR